MGFSRIAVVAFLGLGMAACRPTAGTTIVSLEFDDARVNQLAALPLLAEHDMKATFFVLYPRLLAGGQYFTIDDALAMQRAGHEIGGHTLTHPHLPELSREKQFEEVCHDRDLLRQAGFVADHFAYPFGAYDATSKSVVAQCGYESARTSGGLCENPGFVGLCDRAESIRPRDPFAIRTHASITRERIPDRMRALITDASEHGGGWVQLIFHHICEKCNDYSITQSELQDFLTWLAHERSAGRVRVRTVSEVIHREAGISGTGDAG
jgi:peptidoglycan/xylan/chitin deacetylase (PgdA/CDA1 family)